MASQDFHLPKLITISLLLHLSITTLVSSSKSRDRCYDSIICLGDSIEDTGNALALSEPNHMPISAFPPYGETFFHRPTGRFSDGRLVIDFIAEFLGLPLVPPYYGTRNRSFEKGVNFAVGGGTALDRAFLEAKGIDYNYPNFSLGVQLSTFKESLPSLCGSPSDCREFISNSLIMVGEIGQNDYNYVIYTNKSIQEIKELVPLVIRVISSTIVDLIDMGGSTFLVPGDLPVGCSPGKLTMFQTSNKEDYEPLSGCLKWLNKLAQYHNKKLKTELNRLRRLYPDVDIIYGDYYNSVLSFHEQPAKYGFMNRPLAACCGEGGPYNYTKGVQCGIGVPRCDDPSKYVHWDAGHLTEAAYRWLAKGLLKGPYAHPPFNSSCFSDSKLEDGSSNEDSSVYQSI